MNSENLVASLCVSIKSGNVAEVERVLQLGVDPNSPSSDWARSRPLILAAASGHPDILAALLAHPDLDPNLADGMFGNTALIDASHTGNTDVVRALIQDPRTNVNFKTERSGMTALMQAARYGHSRVVELLVRADPRGVNLQSEVGATPLMLVCMAPNQAVLNNGDIVKSMLAVEEVDLSLEDNQGKTALDWARDKELFMIEKLITERLNSDESNKSSPEFEIRELQLKLKKSEEINKTLRENIEDLTLRIKEQDQKILNLKSR